MKLRNQIGQASLEAVLMMILSLAIAISASHYLRDQGVLANLVEGPWLPLKGMIEDGVWIKAPLSKSQHPNHKKRQQSVAGDPA